jgi:hypothetical protein
MANGHLAVVKELIKDKRVQEKMGRKPKPILHRNSI